MAKPDWASLQQRFLSDNAATGISPKEWCEAQGLIYASARRYIKKNCCAKRSAKQLTVNDNLTDQQRRFVVEYLKDNNATQAATWAGYSAHRPASSAINCFRKLQLSTPSPNSRLRRCPAC